MEDANSGILRGVAPVSGQFVPPVLGPNNGLKPVPAPALDQATTNLQRSVPQGPEGQPPVPQDGAEAEHAPSVTPGENDNQRRVLPGPDGEASSEGSLLPLPVKKN